MERLSLPRRRYGAFALAAVVVIAVSLLALRPGVSEEREIVVAPEPSATAKVAVVKKRAAPAPKPKPKPKKTLVPVQRSPSILLPVSEIRVREIRVEDDGWRVTIRGNVWHERRGVIAQPLLRYELHDRDGALVRTGDFTPSDASGPLWIGFGYGGLKAVPFRLDLDLRRSVPGRAPRAPFSARVKPVSIVEALER